MMRSFQTLLILITIGGFAIPGFHTPLPPRAEVQPLAVQTIPDILLDNMSRFGSYAVAAPKAFWHTPPPPCIGAPGSQTYPESIERIAIYGGEARTLYRRDRLCGAGEVASNIVADQQYLYWVTESALVRLSVNANPGDQPEVVSTSIKRVAELNQVLRLTIDSQSVTVLRTNSIGFALPYQWQIFRYVKATGNIQVLPALDPGISLVQTSPDIGPLSARVYWIDVSGTLHQYVVDTQVETLIDTGVIAYDAGTDGYVFYSKDHSIYKVDVSTVSTPQPVFTGANNDYVLYLDADDNNLFFALRKSPCDTINCNTGEYSNYVARRGRTSIGTTDYLSSFTTTQGNPTISKFEIADRFIFWQEYSSIAAGLLRRLQKDADALPIVNMRITGMLVTQAIQRPDNSVPLIQNRRTFVRVFTQSDNLPVDGVTMRLYRTNSDGGAIDTPLIPVNTVGPNLTIWPAYQQWRGFLNGSFLFELPWGWTTSGPLYLRANLNPFSIPPQQSYGFNSLRAGPLNFQTSPRLQVQFVSWGYTLGGKTYYPRLTDDVLQTYSYIRRTYPLASAPGSGTDPSPGFRPGLWVTYDPDLGAYVNQTATGQDGGKTVQLCQKPYMNDPMLCASAYTNRQMQQMRTEYTPVGSVPLYGMISDAAGFFPRGQATGGNVSTGPAGPVKGTSASNNTYADWYAAHEIGHTLGLPHPAVLSSNGGPVATGAFDCNTYDGTFDGASYPWAYANIGETDTTEGFDSGSPSFQIAQDIYLGRERRDFMSYCTRLWISDFNYINLLNALKNRPTVQRGVAALPERMLDEMLARPTLAHGTLRAPGTARISGDLLAVYGLIANSGEALFTRIRRLSNVAEIPARTPGAYAIRLVSGGTTLVDYPFTPDANDDGGSASFAQVVPFVAGTTQVQLVRLSDGQVIARRALSAHAPTISAVTLQPGASPVTGTITLSWSASDQDGDSLSFDLLYSRDGGATLLPLQLNVREQSAQIDTAELGGGTAIFRVVASDSSNSAAADSAPFSMAAKPPTPQIVAPGDGQRITYGQLLNFSGMADDPQDGDIPDAQLIWTSQRGPLGMGKLLSIIDLAVGDNLVTLTATNSLGLSASTSVHVFVEDTLQLPGPILAVTPAALSFAYSTSGDPARSIEIQIGNVGGGTLSWTAQTSDAWIELATASGGAPSTLMVTASPTLVGDGKAVDGTITISTTSGGAPQTIVVPVSLAVNVNYYARPPWFTALPNRTIWLPLLVR